jgi:hypothetical protein
MNKMFSSHSFIFLAAIFLPQVAAPQGTLYLSSTGTSLSIEPVASDSWVAAAFRCGNNPGGYILDSVQLEMTTASGDPAGFTVQLYGPGTPVANPGSSLATLSGSSDPASAGLYTYTSPDVMLEPGDSYFIVLTAASPSGTGSFGWGLEDPSSNVSAGGLWTEGGATLVSSDGSSWTQLAGRNDPQFALYATAVPEPQTFWLVVMSGVCFLGYRCRVSRVRCGMVGL